VNVNAVRESPVFTITTPSVTVMLSDNRISEVPFTITNVGDRKLRARARVTPAAGTPADWFSVAGDSEQDFDAGAARQFVVRVDPPLGAPAGTYAFRLDAIGIERPDDDYSEGPSCQVTVGQSAPPKLTTPRGYLTTLLGALIGGVVGEHAVVLIILLRHHDDPKCKDLSCVIGDSIGEVIVLLFLLFLAYVLMLVGATLGSGIALRIRRFRGHKLTATFLALLMVPWTILMLATVFQLLDNHLVVLAIVSPIFLVAVPAVLARGGVLLIRTHHV
jgi:uncharacterized membrane protein YhaH (DUF805 family)